MHVNPNNSALFAHSLDNDHSLILNYTKIITIFPVTTSTLHHFKIEFGEQNIKVENKASNMERKIEFGRQKFKLVRRKIQFGKREFFYKQTGKC